MREKLEQYIPSIIKCLDENTLNEVYHKSLQRFNLMIAQQGVKSEEKVKAPSFIEYIISADHENSKERRHYVREIDKAFQILLSDYPQFINDLKKVAARLVKALNTNDIFDNQFDWENIAIELLIMTKLWHKNGVEIKSIEYDLNNGKSIDVFIKHEEYGELLCEFRSIHISLESSISKIRKRVKKIVHTKIKDKTKDLDLSSLPAPLAFLFVIQIQNASELTQEILSSINDIEFDEKVLPIMICRLGSAEKGDKEHFEIVQIKHLVEE